LKSTIKLPKEEWGAFWKALIASEEPISCIEDGATYLISHRQLNTLKKKGINFGMFQKTVDTLP